MNEIQRILSHVRRACDDYSMISEGDKIAVGISGGKDSVTLLTALAEMRRFYPKKYELTAITVDMGFPDSDFSQIEQYCNNYGIEYRVVKTDIAEIIFNVRKEPNPCSLCSKMRRGVLHQTAKSIGCNKVALGHHFDDAVNTFMLNLFFEGRLGCFSPVTYLSNSDIYLIRPLLYTQEKTVEYYVSKTENLPIIKSSCPEDHNTQRENIKLMLADLEKNNKGLRHRIFVAMCKNKIDGFDIFDKMPKPSE